MPDVPAVSSAAPVAPVAPVATPVAAPTPITDAVVKGDFAGFRDAKRKGADLPTERRAAPVAAAPAAQVASTDALPSAGSEPATPKKTADRMQQLLADRATEKARADRLERENAELRRPPAPRTDEPPAASSAATAPTLTDTVRRPDISKPPLGETEFFTAHPAASWADYTQHVTNHALAADRAQQQQTDRQSRADQAQDARAAGFSTKLKASVAADATFVERVSPEVFALEPFQTAIALGKPTGIDNAIAEEIIDSDVAPALMLHLSAHPEALERLRGAKNPRHLNRLFGELEAGLRTAPAAPLSPKTITDAPPPPTTLGTRPASAADPIKSAVASGDFLAFRAAKRAGLANR